MLYAYKCIRITRIKSILTHDYVTSVSAKKQLCTLVSERSDVVLKKKKKIHTVDNYSCRALCLYSTIQTLKINFIY